MVVELTVSSTQLTKATGAPNNAEDKKINDITVFGVNTTSKAVITRKFFSTELTPGEGQDEGKMKVSFKTSEQTDAIYVIANVTNDLTGVGGDLNVSNIGALNNVMASLIVPNKSGGPDKYEAKQTEGNVLMSGYADVTGTVGGSEPATADVQLNLIASKVILKSITRDAGAKGEYGKDFKFVGAMLTNVNTKAYYFADQYPITADSHPSYIGTTSVEGERPSMDDMSTQLVSGGPEDKAAEPNKLEKVKVLYEDLENKEFTGSLTDIAYWYVFENSSDPNIAKTKQTAFQLHYEYMPSDPQKKKDKYISLVFGNEGNPTLEPGKTYTITMSFDADFEAGTTPPGGDDPEAPTVEGQIGVTVTPAEWGTNENVNKPVN